MLPVDAAGRPLMNGVLYNVDSRSTREIADLTATIGAERVVERSGNALTAQSVGPKILWMRRNRPEVLAATDRVMTSTSYIVRRLTGRTIMDHYTAGSWGPMYDVATGGWAADLCDGIIDPACLPDLGWSAEIAGGVTEAAATETGLAVGTPVTVGTIDAASEAISVGVTAPGEMMVMYGSSVFIIEITAHRVLEPRLFTAPWLFPGEHAAMASLATAGTITHWLRDQIGRDLDKVAAMPTLAAEAAASPPGARGLVFLPYLAGAQTPLQDPAARGAFFGLDLTHVRGDMVRSVLEGVANATRHILDTYGDAGAAPERIVAVGGGTKNAVWLQAVSDVAEREQVLPRKTGGAAYGDAFLAALAVGDVAPADIHRWNPPGGLVPPRVETAPIYRPLYGRFRALYERTRDLLGEERQPASNEVSATGRLRARRAISSTLLRQPSLRRRLSRWTAAVLGLMPMAAATRVIGMPLLRSRATSASRPVSVDAPDAGRGRRATRRTSRCASISRAAVTRSRGAAVFSSSASAPARTANSRPQTTARR